MSARDRINEVLGQLPGRGCLPGYAECFHPVSGPFDKGLHPNIDPTCFGVNCEPPVAQPPTGGGTGTGTGTDGNSTSPLDSLAAQLMGGGSGGGLTAAPMTVPVSGGGSGLLLVGLVVAAGVVGWLVLRKKKGVPAK